VAAVPAGVGEGTEHSVVTAYEEHAVLADADGALVAGTREVLRPCDADPATAQEVLLLPVEDSLVGVGLARQEAAVPEGEQDSGQGTRVDGGRHGLDSCLNGQSGYRLSPSLVQHPYPEITPRS
jgi:hypothetical protein